MDIENGTMTGGNSPRGRAFRVARASILTGLKALSTLCLPATQAFGVIYPVGAGSSHSLYIQNPVANPAPHATFGENPVSGMGQQTYHQLGDFAFTNWDIPHIVGCKEGHQVGNVLIPASLPTAMAVAGGRNHSVALRSDDSVVTWGDSTYGQLGYNNYLSRKCATQSSLGIALPTRGLVPFNMPVLAIAAGDYHTYAIAGTALPYSTIRSWGRSNAGQVGNGKAMGTNYPAPDCVRTNVYPIGVCLTAVRSVAAGAAHGVAATLDGKVHSWGSDSDGQRGEPGVSGDRSWAQEVPGIDNVISVAARGYISLALKQDGTVWCWGRFQSEHDSNQWISCGATPTQVPGLTGVTQIAAGRNHALAITNDGKVWGWGYNTYGGVGNPAVSYTIVPALVALPVPSFAVAIAAGDYHSIVRTADNKTYSWGRNQSGQLGIGGYVNQFSPMLVPTP